MDGRKLLTRRTKPKRKGTRLVRSKGCGQRTITDVRRSHRLFLGIDFTSGTHRCGKGEAHIFCRFAIEFDHADNDLVSRLRFLESKHPNATVVQMEQREA